MPAPLRERARAMAEPAAEPDRPTLPVATDNTPDSAPLPDIEYDAPIIDAAQVPVHTAWARVMADVQTITKGDRRDDAAGRYNFRGVDRVINAVGPALRRHGVLVLSTRVFDVEYREQRTTQNKPIQECTLKVEWIVVGPKGDTIEHLVSAGQANDSADKATAKAMSVAQRVLFLTCLHVPTHDPTIDQGHDRGERPMPSPTDYRDEIVNPSTSLGRLKAIRGELFRLGLGAVAVMNEVGDEEGLIPMIDRIGRERRDAVGGES